MSEEQKAKWPDEIRLKMIEKSGFYSDPKIYQYGYYDGYQLLQSENARLKKESDAYFNDYEYWQDKAMKLELALSKAEGEAEKWIDILRENQQAQIAGYYSHDKTDEERKIRNAVIEEYRDLILIFKSRQTKLSHAADNKKADN